jgi:hypothetical protein
VNLITVNYGSEVETIFSADEYIMCFWKWIKFEDRILNFRIIEKPSGLDFLRKYWQKTSNFSHFFFVSQLVS